jgi:hypothetical protein
MLVPLFGFLRGDSLGLLVLVHDHETVAHVALCLQEAACVRVKPSTNATVYHAGRALDRSLSVGQAGLTAFERVDVVPESDG